MESHSTVSHHTSAPLKPALVLGWGNPDRQDDGAAWHVLCEVTRRLNMTPPDNPEDEFDLEGETADVLFVLQLLPELSERLAEYERVCMVDAHTGEIPEPLHAEAVTPAYQSSPFTHHLTPSTALALAETVGGRAPQTLLVSVRGYSFEFARELSPQTAALVPQATDTICTWVTRTAPDKP